MADGESATAAAQPKKRRSPKCSLCGTLGHNKTQCPRRTSESVSGPRPLAEAPEAGAAAGGAPAPGVGGPLAVGPDAGAAAGEASVPAAAVASAGGAPKTGATRKCGICKQAGHDRRKCPQAAGVGAGNAGGASALGEDAVDTAAGAAAGASRRGRAKGARQPSAKSIRRKVRDDLVSKQAAKDKADAKGYFERYCEKWEQLNALDGGPHSSASAHARGQRQQAIEDWHWDSEHPGGLSALENMIKEYERHGPRAYDDTEVLDLMGAAIREDGGAMTRISMCRLPPTCWVLSPAPTKTRI